MPEWFRLISNCPPAELMVRRRHLQTGVAQVPQHLQQKTVRVAFAPDDVHVSGGIGVPAETRRRVVGLEDEELQLRPDDRGDAQ